MTGYGSIVENNSSQSDVELLAGHASSDEDSEKTMNQNQSSSSWTSLSGILVAGTVVAGCLFVATFDSVINTPTWTSNAKLVSKENRLHSPRTNFLLALSDNYHDKESPSESQHSIDAWKSMIHSNADPSIPLFHKQIVDHLAMDKPTEYYQQRYYQNLRYWDGPGNPIFVILGGEGVLTKILYPFISEVLAEQFGAATLCPEHRYFGMSRPVPNPTLQELQQQLTPRQSLEDFVHFIKAKQYELGCASNKDDPSYCPIVTIGGSYPGLLSALIRINYPDTVDIGYAAGVPFHTWDNSNPQWAANQYYDKITRVADRESPGCAAAIKGAIQDTLRDLNGVQLLPQEDIAALAADYGICSTTVPHDIKTEQDLAEAIVDVLPGRFSNTNMDYYPPSPDQPFIQDCRAFQQDNASAREKFQTFFRGLTAANNNNNNNNNNKNGDECYDMSDNGEEGDDDDSDKMWEILCCRLAPVMGHSHESMFAYKEYNAQHDIDSCRDQFGIVLDPSAMAREFHFSYEDLTQQSRLLLTNGDNDGWAALSYLEDIDNGVVSMTFPNGAHHSELLHFLAPENDTDDIRQGHEAIAVQIGMWLEQIKAEASVND